MLDVLTQKQTDFIEKAMRQLLARSEARAVLLANEAGYVLAEQSYDDVADFAEGQNIAALASGAFFATREMARIVGEDEFRSVLHQGNRSGIFIMLVASTLIMIIVFDRNTNPGLVKLLAEGTARELESFFATEAQASPADPPSHPAFQLASDQGIFEAG